MVSWTAPAANGSPITSYTVTPFIGTTAQTPVQVNNGSATSATVNGLTNGTAYTFKVTATNAIGTSAASAASPSATPNDTIFDLATPSVVDSNDSGSGNLGVKFTADTSGQITGIRFYKAATNTGAHSGSLWTAGGQLLASANFTNETPSGWQTVLFSSPVSITAGTTYVASYFDPNGHYSLQRLLGSPRRSTTRRCTRLATGTSANGLYNYSSTSSFPTNAYNGNNYWVDVAVPADAPGPGHQRHRDRWACSRRPSAGRRRAAAGSRPTRSRRSSAPRRRRRRP